MLRGKRQDTESRVWHIKYVKICVERNYIIYTHKLFPKKYKQLTIVAASIREGARAGGKLFTS